jgi:hypothetical protein
VPGQAGDHGEFVIDGLFGGTTTNQVFQPLGQLQELTLLVGG